MWCATWLDLFMFLVLKKKQKTVMLMVDVNEALQRLCWNDYYRPQTKFGAN